MSVQRTLFKKACSWLKCKFANLKCATMFFLEMTGFLLPTNLVFHRAMNSVKEFLFQIFVTSGLKWKVLDVEKFLILPCYFFLMYLVLLVFWHATKLWQLKIVILHNVADFGLFFCLHPSCSLVHPMHRLLHCKYWFLILSPAAFRPQRSIGVKHIC